MCRKSRSFKLSYDFQTHLESPVEAASYRRRTSIAVFSQVYCSTQYVHTKFFSSKMADDLQLLYPFFIYFADRASQYISLNINQLDALNFIVSLFHASTCFEHTCSSSGGQNCTIQSSLNLCTGHTPIGVMIPEKSSLNLCTGRPPIGVMIPEIV